MRQIILFALIILITTACENQTSKKDNDLNAKLDSLLNENRRLNDKISKIEQENGNKQNKELAQPVMPRNNYSTNNTNENSSLADNNTSGSKKYAFVLLSIIKKEFDGDKWRSDRDLERSTGIDIPDEGYSMVNYYVTSKIQTFNNLNEDTKYKFIDEVQSNLKYSSGGFNLESIKKRQCLVFNSYKEASLARAKYTTDEDE